MKWKGKCQEELIPESTRRPPSEIQEKRMPRPEIRTEKTKYALRLGLVIGKSQSKFNYN